VRVDPGACAQLLAAISQGVCICRWAVRAPAGGRWVGHAGGRRMPDEEAVGGHIERGINRTGGG